MLNNSNWSKNFTEIDKKFYNKFVSTAVENLYDMEIIINNSLIEYQKRLPNVKTVNNYVEVDDLIKTVDEVLTPVKDKHELNKNKLVKLHDEFMEELVQVTLFEKAFNTKNYSIIKSRALISDKKYKDVLYAIIKESQDLMESFSEQINSLLDYYFKTIDDNIDILENINVRKLINDTKTNYEKIFKQKDIIKYLESNGFYYKNTGRHSNYTNGINTIPIPAHGSKDLGFGLQRKIQKEVIEYKI